MLMSYLLFSYELTKCKAYPPPFFPMFPRVVRLARVGGRQRYYRTVELMLLA
ncbi:hypothetical protein F383_23692 [Gossypium arboreum]|uniref:Uncharacterized protein n=1 Tax=Gossypium arboreum TaxID=29729 RepID=A0A0B0P392_GOSAR|nr:hypothetical protein F383_23692 [Gossypium arboreum]